MRAVMAAACAALLLAGTTRAADAAADRVDLSSLSVVPNPRLGLAFPGDQTRYYPYLARAGLGVVRLSVSWAHVEPRPGRFEWRGLDGRIAALQAVGIQPFLTFESDAGWATKPGTQKVRNAAPEDLSQWHEFVHAVAERYDGDGRDDMPGLKAPVRWYQAANEWESDSNRSGGWVGSGADLVAYVNTAYDAVKSADPDSTFVLGGIASFSADVALVALKGADIPVRQQWSETSKTVLTRAEMRGPEVAAILKDRVMPLFEQGRFDMADVHLYGREERDAARIALVRELAGRPVLSSECGGPSLDYGGRYTPEAHFLAVVHRNLGVLAAGADFCLWYRLGDSDGATYGNRYTALYDAEAHPRPGVFAYRLLARIVDAKAAVHMLDGGGFEIVRGEGTAIRMAWGPAGGAVRTWAVASGADAYCLADASSGALARLSRGASPDCREDAFTVAGSGLSRLLSSD
jgi:hypothetical protein